MRPISVLVTNNALAARGGSETYVRDVALALLQRGHRPVAFSLLHGDVATELRRATVPVLDDLSRLTETPDVIHGHHHLETLIAALTFPDTPVVNFCHGWIPWEEMPLHHPSVRRYVAVDEVCADRLTREEGIQPDRVELLLNFVDLDRFRARAPLPPRPVRALILSNAATASGYGRFIVDACAAAGIDVDIVGNKSGRSSAAPELLLPSYDLVFAKGRSALEALAVGCATVVTDAAGAGPLVMPDNFDRLRARNFGIRELQHPHDAAWYGAQIAQYDAAAHAEVSARVRSQAGMTQAIDRLLDLYARAMAAPRDSGNASRAAANHCCRIAPPLKEAYTTLIELQRVGRDLEQARTELNARSQEDARRLAAAAAAVQTSEALAASQAKLLEQHLRDRDRQLSSTRDELASTHAELHRLRSQVAEFQALPTLRLRDTLLRTPMAGPWLQAAARRLAKLLSRS